VSKRSERSKDSGRASSTTRWLLAVFSLTLTTATPPIHGGVALDGYRLALCRPADLSSAQNLADGDVAIFQHRSGRCDYLRHSHNWPAR
jgi:hypothetical protein